MADKTWKAVERAIARILGGKRTGPRGEDWPDVIVGDFLAAEIKHGYQMPNYLKGWMIQAEVNAAKRCPGNLPLVVWHEKGQPYLQSLVIMRLEEFAERYCYREESEDDDGAGGL